MTKREAIELFRNVLEIIAEYGKATGYKESLELSIALEGAIDTMEQQPCCECKCEAASLLLCTTCRYSKLTCTLGHSCVQGGEYMPKEE